MPFDATVLGAVTAELDGVLRGGRVNKVYQPSAWEIDLIIYAGRTSRRLLLTCHPQHARLHLTRAEKPNPPAPPTFCMLLRKHLEGGRIAAVRQAGRDRVAEVVVQSLDELGNPVCYRLVAEVMGKHSNLVLLAPGDRIVDAARRVTEEVNRYREVLPGLPYTPPPPTRKLDPAAVTAGELAARLAPGGDPPRSAAWQWLLDRVDGMGPLTARSVAHRAGAAATPAAELDAGALERLAAACRSLAADWDAGRFEPCLLYSPDGALKDFAAFPPAHWGGRAAPQATMSEALDLFYAQREQEERYSRLHGEAARTVAAELARTRRKEAAQAAELAGAESADDLRLRGELLTAHVWQVQKGAVRVDLPNWHDPDGPPMAIDLDPALTPAENAQQYFRRYQKARAGLETIRSQLGRTRAERDYLEQVEETLALAASLPELEEIRRELTAEGYLELAGERGRPGGRAARPGRRGESGRDDARREAPAPPLTLRSADGLEIWVGRNNRQNDYLTTRLAAPHDLWLHTKEIPGAHVILRLPPGADPPERSLLEAAALAAYFSRARGSSQVPVDYARRKHVRKPNGARPGMVIYDNQRTLYVTPDPAEHPILARAALPGEG